ncbi:hypothetical protein GCM10017774_08260 [Lentzea cavernae]|uniref:Uncharacterized protein n=1 Tax=Lentzea cavernae TaxID=2020703 RepID=A0ABQ3M2Z5_9PSEU|nr:hypothetical protein GCM10017774_08260 [Lentzea cavernae]
MTPSLATRTDSGFQVGLRDAGHGFPQQKTARAVLSTRNGPLSGAASGPGYFASTWSSWSASLVMIPAYEE